MDSYNNAYTEVYTILQELDEEEYSKIPSDLIEAIRDNRNMEYDYILDDEAELKDQPLLRETKAILFNIFRDYLATPEQKEKIIRMQNEERQRNELKKQQMYDVDVFANHKTVIDENKEIAQNMEMIEYKENFFMRIIKRIKKFFIR